MNLGKPETVAQRLYRLSQEILEIKEIKVLIGAEKIPVDRDDVIIFHIDI